ncbi:hypothetical protein ABB29_02130 [Pseudoxanthomonas dokdonensis]|uniref:Uncharacterized protein n=1 Tax=Pseudoxanthomonas dokdonensis TaxID=344882 RepID=A0A0R0CZV5_9GAMM|nr:hypothetical protein ABB29_02130 [Pseudoxanthomonas dokdonensis]
MRWDRKRVVERSRHWFWILLFVAYAAAATTIAIDTLNPRYRDLSQVALTTVDSADHVRMSGASQVAAVYRASSGTPFSALPSGSSFRIIWPDGSSETVVVVDPKAVTGSQPLPGSQQAASGKASVDVDLKPVSGQR